MALRSVSTVDEVIDALGGTGATAKIMSLKPQHISNWRAEKRIAARTFKQFEAALIERGLKAPSALWGIIDPLAPPPKRRKKRAKKS